MTFLSLPHHNLEILMKVSFNNSLTTGIYSFLSIGYGMTIAGIVLTVLMIIMSLFSELPVFFGLSNVGIELQGNQINSMLKPEGQNLMLSVHDGEIIFLKPDFSMNLLSGISQLVLFATILLVTILLRKIIFSIKENNVFSSENVNRIKFIGLVIIILPIIHNILNYIYYNLFISNINITNIQLSYKPDISLGTSLYGALILILANVFREGNKMKNEIELTV